ncbi:MAG: hypothetical protein IKC63_04970 [Clostridia bacterium]|nr:hypothetical protein [Clostridia bacterium]
MAHRILNIGFVGNGKGANRYHMPFSLALPKKFRIKTVYARHLGGPWPDLPALAETEVKFADKNACCVIMASGGYPTSYKKGFEITLPAEVAENVYVAGAEIADGKLVTSGGRVLGVTAVADTLKDAIDASYGMVEKISFEGGFFRHDIGARAMAAKEA